MRSMVRGEGKAGCIFWTLLAIFVGLVATRVVPIQVAKMQLKDEMKDLALTQPRKPGSYFEKRILERARDLDLPVEKRNIKVDKRRDRVIMDVEFTIVVDMVLVDYPWNVKLHLDRDLFL